MIRRPFFVNMSRRTVRYLSHADALEDAYDDGSKTWRVYETTGIRRWARFEDLRDDWKDVRIANGTVSGPFPDVTSRTVQRVYIHGHGECSHVQYFTRHCEAWGFPTPAAFCLETYSQITSSREVRASHSVAALHGLYLRPSVGNVKSKAKQYDPIYS
jgi:hypothetical protein